MSQNIRIFGVKSANDESPIVGISQFEQRDNPWSLQSIYMIPSDAKQVACAMIKAAIAAETGLDCHIEIITESDQDDIPTFEIVDRFNDFGHGEFTTLAKALYAAKHVVLRDSLLCSLCIMESAPNSDEITIHEID